MYDSEKKQFIIPLSKRHRIELKLSEAKVLYHLIKNKTVPSRILHDLFRMLVNSDMKSSNISDRLKRLTEVDILRRLEEPITFNLSTSMYRSFYQLGNEGLEFLQKVAPELSKDIDELRLQLDQSSIPTKREQTASIIVMDVIMNMMQKGKNLKYERAVNHEMFLHTKIFSKRNFGLYPVFVLEDADQLVCLVVNPKNPDRYTNFIREFILNHYQSALTYANSVGKKFSLVFSVQDGSLNLNSRRVVSNTQDEMFALKASIQADFGKNPKHFPTYVFPTTRTVTGIIDSVFCSEKSELNSDGVNNSMLNLLEEARINVETIDRNSFFGNSRIIFEELFLLDKKHKTSWIGVIYGKEGSVTHFNEINSIGRKTKGGRVFNGYPICVIVIYDNRTVAQEDLVWNERNMDIWITDLETWKAHINAGNYGFPQMMKLTGIDTKRYMEFHL